MSWQEAFYFLAAFTLVRELFFQYSVNKLINKLMSRNYFEYQQSERVRSEKRAMKSEKIDDDMPEDLGTIQGIGVF